MNRTGPLLFLLGSSLLFQPGLAQNPIPSSETSEALKVARQLNKAFVELAERVSPSVVVVKVTQKSDPHQYTSEDPTLELLPPNLRKEFERQRERFLQGHGSGIIIREDGFILTNRHVVEDAEKIKIRLQDGTEYDGEIRGVDKESDIAVIKVEAKNLKAARLGDSDQTRVGEFAIAIGAPFGLDYSVTFGHINAKGRADLDLQLMDQDFLQTDASINPGNSGGPLVNIEGEVIGINTLIRGLGKGIGFAIPINIARSVSDQIIESGRFTRAWLGVAIKNVTELENFGGYNLKEGVLVTAIPAQSPASKSILDVEDVIVGLDGTPIGTIQKLRNEVRTKKIGQEVTLKVQRDGKPLDVKIVLGEMPARTAMIEERIREAPGKKDANSPLGLTVAPLSTDLEKKFRQGGVLITSVASGSVAAEKAIGPGDVITRINKKKIRNVTDFNEAVKEADLKKGVKLTLVGEKGTRLEDLAE